MAGYRVVQRIVGQITSHVRLCYQQGLRDNARLTGNVQVSVVIDHDGAVSRAIDAGSSLPDTRVVACVVRSFKALSFPAPDVGFVTVTYPIDLEPGR